MVLVLHTPPIREPQPQLVLFTPRSLYKTRDVSNGGGAENDPPSSNRSIGERMRFDSNGDSEPLVLA
jgi:hypothetical protein